MKRHIPVLLDEVLDSLLLEPGMNVIDCTLGDAGHAERILEKTAPNGSLLGIDADAESLLRAKQYLHDHDGRVIFVRDTFENLEKIVQEETFSPVHRILFDLGWSSPQFQDRGRGFSFQNLAEPLDMRYDTRMECIHEATDPPLGLDGQPLYGKCTAAELVNTMDADALEQVLSSYGEEKFSKDIAKAIVEKRKEYELETVGDLVNVVLTVYRVKLHSDKEVPWIGGTHPATQVFQALRIAVNDEFEVLKKGLEQAVCVVQPGGRIAVITFHSLEDRIVKHFFKSKKSELSIITKKPIIASDEELKKNPRARSAKLRVVQKHT